MTIFKWRIRLSDGRNRHCAADSGLKFIFQTTHQILVPGRSGTGEVMLPQSGYILINALDGTELLHSNEIYEVRMRVFWNVLKK